MLRKHFKGQRKDAVMFFLNPLLASSKLRFKTFCTGRALSCEGGLDCVLEMAELGWSLHFGVEIT